MDSIRSLLLLISLSAVATCATADSAAPIEGFQDEAPAHHLIWPVAECEGDNPDALTAPLLILFARGSSLNPLLCSDPYIQYPANANPTRAPPFHF